jgi:hypothetical protein
MPAPKLDRLGEELLRLAVALSDHSEHLERLTRDARLSGYDGIRLAHEASRVNVQLMRLLNDAEQSIEEGGEVAYELADKPRCSL